MINLDRKLVGKTYEEQLKLIYQWVKCDIINFKEFKELFGLIADGLI